MALKVCSSVYNCSSTTSTMIIKHIITKHFVQVCKNRPVKCHQGNQANKLVVISSVETTAQKDSTVSSSIVTLMNYSRTETLTANPFSQKLTKNGFNEGFVAQKFEE